LAQHVAFADQRRDRAGERPLTAFGAAEQHVGETGMNAKLRHLPAVRRYAVSGVERIELAEQFARLRKRRSRRRVEPAQLHWIDNACSGQLEREGREVGLENFRRRASEEVRVFYL